MLAKMEKDMLALRLHTGEDLLESLQAACKKAKFGSGVILSGVGMLEEVKLGYFRGRGEGYSEHQFRHPVELVSFSGNVAPADGGKSVFHIHAAIADDEGRCHGGHLLSAKVRYTCEIFIRKLPLELKRKLEEETGLAGLSMK